MAVQCPQCGRQYDVTLFEFQRSLRCDCGTVLDLQEGHMVRVEPGAEPTPGLELACGPASADSPVTQLILVRHAETDADRAGRIQGQSDTHLNMRGRHQALDLAQGLLDEPLAAIYSSDLKRCLETAELIARTAGLDVQATPELREARFGPWEGRTAGEVRSAFADEYQAWCDDAFNFRPPGGESQRELLERVVAFLREVARRHAGSKVLIVTGGGACNVALHHVLGIAITARSPFRADSGSIHRIEVWRGSWRVVALNDTCHLGKTTMRQGEQGEWEERP